MVRMHSARTGFVLNMVNSDGTPRPMSARVAEVHTIRALPLNMDPPPPPAPMESDEEQDDESLPEVPGTTI